MTSCQGIYVALTVANPTPIQVPMVRLRLNQAIAALLIPVFAFLEESTDYDR